MKLILLPCLGFIISFIINSDGSYSYTNAESKVYRYQGEFQMGMSSTLLRNPSNWDDSTLNNCEHGEFLSGIRVNSHPQETLPSKKLILDQIHLAYKANGNVFFNRQKVLIVENGINVAEAIIYLRHAH